MVRDLIKGDREIGSQYFVNIALKALEYVQDITEGDEKVERTVLFLTKDYIQSKPSTGDPNNMLMTTETVDGGPGRYSDISSKNPSIKAPRKHLETSINVGKGHQTTKPVVFKAPWQPLV